MGISPLEQVISSSKPTRSRSPFEKKFDVYILNRYVEADHDRVGFDEDITCASGDIPIVGMFT